MKAVVYLSWINGGRLQDSFWRVVEMPSLPPVGAVLFFDEPDCDAATVTEIQWWQKQPDIFEIHASIGEPRGTADGIIADFESAGWLQEGKKYFGEK